MNWELKNLTLWSITVLFTIKTFDQKFWGSKTLWKQLFNHQQFKPMLDKIDSEYGDLVYVLNVPWLSRAATLKRSWDLKSKIQNFMKEKGQDVTFFDKRFLTKLALLVDITQYLSDLNLKLQDKNQLADKMFEHILPFNWKLVLFQSQLKKSDIVHLGTLKTWSEVHNPVSFMYTLML